MLSFLRNTGMAIFALLIGASPVSAVDTNTSAGVLLYSKQAGKIWVLLGHESNNGKWCDFGGGGKEEDVDSKANALRELREETRYVYGEQIPVPLDKPYQAGSYRQYFAEVPFMPIPYLMRSNLERRKPEELEMNAYLWIPLDELLAAVSGKNLGEEIRLPEKYILHGIMTVRYDGTDIDSAIAFRKTITGVLPNQLDMVWMQLQANLVEKPVAENGIRQEFLPDYPIEALKELARNMIQHRLYEGTHSPGRIEWYRDHMEFHNPGGPFGHASEGQFGETSDYRNPIITGKLAEQGYVQRLGRGIRRVRQLLAKNGNPPLEVKTDGYTHVSVRTGS